MRRFYAYIASEGTLYGVTPVTLFSTMERMTGITQKQPKKPTKSMNSHKKTQGDIKVKSPLFIL